RVDLGQRQAVRLDIELPRHRQDRLAAKEILREIHLALRRSRQAGIDEIGRRRDLWPYRLAPIHPRRDAALLPRPRRQLAAGALQRYPPGHWPARLSRAGT